MPIARIGDGLSKRVQRLETQVSSGRVDTMVAGTSTGFGGTEPPIYIPTAWPVKHAVANLAKEYDLRDASQIYNFGNDVFSGQIKVTVPPSGNGFYVDFMQLDPNEPWQLVFNWLALGW